MLFGCLKSSPNVYSFMLLQVENLSIAIKSSGQKLCNNLNFNIMPGETLGILGESGSGKSITALSIPGLLSPALQITHGKILFCPEPDHTIDLASSSVKELQRIRGAEIGVVFQEPMTSLNPVFTCGNQVEDVLRRHKNLSAKEAKTQAIGLFAKVKLPAPEQVYKKYPHQLSGGQKQRVMIAMAIACSPSLLIADEPTTALDVTVQKSILELLRELQKEMGMAIIFITHDISVLSEIADRTLVFYKGELVEEGPIKQILNAPQHPYTQQLIACRETRLAVNTSKSEIQMPLLKVNNLSVSFRQNSGWFAKTIQKQVLHNVCFELYKGETLGLVGESGSGKTTIGRAIMQLIEPENGFIELNGKPVNHADKQELRNFRKQVQIIFQDPYSSLNPKLTIGQTLMEPLLVHGIGKSRKEQKNRVIDLLEMVQLSEEHFNRYPHQFSGGQRQRIGIARALAAGPDVIILDESVAALDVLIQAQVLNLLQQLKNELGLTYLFISHDLEIVQSFSNRVIVLQNGNIVEEGDSDNIFNHPQHAYTKSLIAAIPGR